MGLAEGIAILLMVLLAIVVILTLTIVAMVLRDLKRMRFIRDSLAFDNLREEIKQEDCPDDQLREAVIKIREILKVDEG